MSITFDVSLASANAAANGGAQGQLCDTPQVYFGFPGADQDTSKPNKVLRFFKKVCFDAETAISSLQSVSYTFTNADVSNWDVSRKQWAVTEGEYAVLVGASSQDIRLTGSFTV